jgi:hypothetical protein
LKLGPLNKQVARFTNVAMEALILTRCDIMPIIVIFMTKVEISTPGHSNFYRTVNIRRLIFSKFCLRLRTMTKALIMLNLLKEAL